MIITTWKAISCLAASHQQRRVLNCQEHSVDQTAIVFDNVDVTAKVDEF
jgi:hypothetical protein